VTTVERASREFVRTADGLSTVFTMSNLEEQLHNLLDSGEAFDPADLALLDQMMVEKAEGYVSVIRNLEAMSAARKAEADRLRDRAKQAETAADWLKARLLTHLQVTGRTRLETTRFTLTVRQNPASVQIVDEAAIPADYVIVETTYRINKRGILDDFKRDGALIPGVEITHGERLSIA